MSDVITPMPGMEVTVNVTGDSLPSGGTNGQVLTRTETGHEWRDLPSGLPDGGNPGDVLVRTESGAEWQAMDKLASEDADELMNMLK